MSEILDKFFGLLRLSIGASSDVPDIQPADWRLIYKLAEKQSLLGVVFDGVERMGDAVRMDEDLLMVWLGKCRKIERRNRLLYEAVVRVSEYFGKKGFDACILKGQGNALMYPKPLRRTPGDVDIWVSGEPADVIRFVHSVAPSAKASYHHIDFPAYKGVAVEVHYRPCYLQNVVHNARLQRFFRLHAREQFSHRAETEYGGFALPTASFNVVYQLVHIYNHLFQEGIGLRQIVDYYYVVRSGEANLDLGSLQRELRHLGLWKFASALMFVLHEALGLPKNKLLAPMDERRGRLLLNEIIQGGNFGKYDKRYSFARGALGHNMQRLFRDLRLVRCYPAEALSEPIFRLWHFWWRLAQSARLRWSRRARCWAP